MFEIGKTYWLKLNGHGGQVHNVKGKALEENAFMVKMETLKGMEIIPFTRILNVQESREDLRESIVR